MSILPLRTTLRCLTCRGDYLTRDDDGLPYCLQCRASVFVFADVKPASP